MMKLIGFLILIMIAPFSYGQNKYLIILGGGGEPKGDTTIFDSNLSLMGDFSKKHPEYQVDVSFNGGHSKTENIIWSKFKEFKQDQHFTGNNFEKMILKYERMIESGEIRPGDNLLINIDTHGSIKNGMTHKISTVGSVVADLNTLSTDVVSLDRLKKLTELAEKKGVNLGIIDLSCHSGNTLKLSNSKTCVISASGENHFAYAGDNPDFFANLIPKALSSEKTLEDAFIKARSVHRDLSFPMISSPNGEWVQSKLYKSLTPFLNFFTEGEEKFTPFLKEDLITSGECRLDESFQEIQQEMTKFKSLISDSSLQFSLEKLSKSVNSYYAYINEIKTKMKKAGLYTMNEPHQFCSEISSIKECIGPMSLDQLSLFNFQIMYDYYQKAAETADAKTKIRYQLIIENYKKAERLRNKTLQENPSYLDTSNFWKKISRLGEDTRKYADAVYEAEREVYKALYLKRYQSQPNPCRNFKI